MFIRYIKGEQNNGISVVLENSNIPYPVHWYIKNINLRDHFLVKNNFFINGLYIISYLFGSIVVNLSCKNSHYYTVQEEQF